LASIGTFNWVIAAIAYHTKQLRQSIGWRRCNFSIQLMKTTALTGVAGNIQLLYPN